MESERISILLERQKKSKFSLTLEFRNTNFKSILIEEVFKKLNGIVESQRGEINRAPAGDKQLRRDQLLLHEHLSEQNWDLREANLKSLHEMEDLKRAQESRIDESSRRRLIEPRRRLIENHDTIHELTARIQELQNEVSCLSDSRDLKVLSQYPVDNPTFPVNPRYSHLFAILAGCLAILWDCRAAEKGRQTFGTRMFFSGNVFVNPLLHHLIKEDSIN